MKRVIEIPEELYKQICEIAPKFEDCSLEWEAIINGTPLDKVLDKIIDEIAKAKQYRGKSGNSVIDKHNIGLDKYFDLGLDKALKIINEYKENEGKE